jgi:EAL domain-containing protein (putative c-di-GMP-specific phosphodiesterase class I)
LADVGVEDVAHVRTVHFSQEVAVAVAPPSADVRTARPVPGHRAVTGVLSGVSALRVDLQPIVDLGTGEVWGLEALARFPGHPMPGPAAWFAAALRDGRGTALEEVALRGALAVLPMLPPDLRLTVNLSAEALLLPAVQATLRALADERVLIELTEHEQVGDYPALVAALGAMRERGIGMCIDDFGAGHSSLRHVLHLEPDVVKLDLALVQGVGECPRRQALVEAMLTFCRSTGAMLVAEGVEEADDLSRLVALGVTHAQGWFLARPAGPDVVLPALAASRTPVLVLP